MKPLRVEVGHSKACFMKGVALRWPGRPCLATKYQHMSQPQTNPILCFDFLYQFNTGQADGTPGLDLNVAEAWELGYTGKGVTIGIMDDGEYLIALQSFARECLSHLQTWKIGVW